jgi:hypothetical protein
LSTPPQLTLFFFFFRSEKHIEAVKRFIRVVFVILYGFFFSFHFEQEKKKKTSADSFPLQALGVPEQPLRV